MPSAFCTLKANETLDEITRLFPLIPWPVKDSVVCLAFMHVFKVQ